MAITSLIINTFKLIRPLDDIPYLNKCLIDIGKNIKFIDVRAKCK